MPNAHFHDNQRGWTDLDDHSRFRNRIPTVIITADEIANGEWDGLLGDDFKGQVVRKVVYVDSAGNRQYMELTLYVHRVGAGALTIRTGATSNTRGKLLTELGAFTGAVGIENDTIAGGMLSQYSLTSSEIGSATAQEPVWETTLNEGDAIWLVRKGRWLALGDGAAVTAGSPVVADNSNGTDGAVQDASTMGTPNAAEILQNLTGPHGNCVGYSREATNATVAGYAYIDLDLGNRFGAP